MSAYDVPRREFLLRALTACSAPLVAELSFAAGIVGQQPRRAGNAGEHARLAESYVGIASLTAAHAIAVAYLRHLGVGREVDSIVGAATATRELIEKAADEDAAVTMLVDAVRGDFIERRSVQLEGWVFSRTELEVCLLTLLPPSPQGQG